MDKDGRSQYEYAVREIMTVSHILQYPRIGNSAMSQNQNRTSGRSLESAGKNEQFAIILS